MKKNLLRLVIMALTMSQSAWLLADEFYFFIRFTDKNNTPYSLEEPGRFLSNRALQRRALYKLELDSTDLPVNPAYIEQVRSLGVSIHSQSKWFNGITILTSDSTRIDSIRPLRFVKQVHYTGRKKSSTQVPQKLRYQTSLSEYGSALAQIDQLKGRELHQRGARGKGILIAVLDGGFRNADTNPGLDSMRLNNRLAGHVNVVNPSADVFREDQHGALVLSAMAGNLPGSYLGTAPDASYYLILTEHAPTEYLVETDFWVRGAELADSIGADLINSSLGYTEFDDPAQNFKYADMNGTVARSSIAAEMAARKGIIVCTSAGNSGNQSWKYLSSPADARSIISVGSVDVAGNTSSFSSYGPASDGRIKPELAATGSRTALISTSGTVVYSYGTSFSAPLITGMVACYLQLLREQHLQLSVDQLIHNLTQSAHLYSNPHPQTGYGIPDFSQLPELTSQSSFIRQTNPFTVSIDLRSNQLSVHLSDCDQPAHLLLFDVSGRLIYQGKPDVKFLDIPLEAVDAGIYILQVSIGKQCYFQKLHIQ